MYEERNKNMGIESGGFEGSSVAPKAEGGPAVDVIGAVSTATKVGDIASGFLEAAVEVADVVFAPAMDRPMRQNVRSAPPVRGMH